ncbi:MAG: flagellar assembly protein FliW [Spirochaetaceae bacterium]|jgi:flagellar assembly factor FliW|nr:flagellar assembly protein FliW [Spirochaetaceae bacterium]
MKIQTKAYGLIEIDERQKVSFPAGLFGFESVKDYVLIDAERQPFYWLQSLEAEHIAFITINPFLFRPDYELDIEDDLLKDIGITKAEDALVFSIVTIPPGGPMTANLQGPLIINRETRIGRQGILSDSRWKTKHDILEELKLAGTGGKDTPC